MGIVSRAADIYYTFRFLKTLVTKWEDMPAYKLGIIDDNGTYIWDDKGRAMTGEEKDAYTIFHRLVFNIKRLLGKVPGGKSVVARYGAALFLIKEHTGMSEKAIIKALEKYLETDLQTNEINENTWYQDSEDRLTPGNYILQEDTVSLETGEVIALKNSRVNVDDMLYPCGSFNNINIYKVKHKNTKQYIHITNRDINR